MFVVGVERTSIREVIAADNAVGLWARPWPERVEMKKGCPWQEEGHIGIDRFNLSEVMHGWGMIMVVEQSLQTKIKCI